MAGHGSSLPGVPRAAGFRGAGPLLVEAFVGSRLLLASSSWPFIDGEDARTFDPGVHLHSPQVRGFRAHTKNWSSVRSSGLTRNVSRAGSFWAAGPLGSVVILRRPLGSP